MIAQFNRSAVLIGLLLGALVAAGGCGGNEIEITQYPPFFDPDDPAGNVKSIVILPFRNQAAGASGAKAGEAISEELAGMLAGSATYQKVYNRNDLRNLMDQQDLAIAAGGDSNAMATALRKRGAVDAMLTGAVTTYSSSSKRIMKEEPKIVGYNKKKMPIIKMVKVPATANEGIVTVAVSLIKIRDGAQIHSTGPLSGGHKVVGTGNVMSESECLLHARARVVSQAKDHFAVVRKRITVDSDAFLVASAYYEGEWDEEDEFTTMDTTAFVVLKLPNQCDRNRFTVKITREERREDLLTQGVHWKKGQQPAFIGSPDVVDAATHGIGVLKFSPRDLAEKAGGPGTYVAKFYAGPRPALEYEFDIESPDE